LLREDRGYLRSACAHGAGEQRRQRHPDFFTRGRGFNMFKNEDLEDFMKI